MFFSFLSPPPLYPLPPGEGKGVVGEGIEGDFPQQILT